MATLYSKATSKKRGEGLHRIGAGLCVFGNESAVSARVRPAFCDCENTETISAKKTANARFR